MSPSSFSCTDVAGNTNALSFNGTQYGEGTHAQLPQGNAVRTLEAWVYPTAANQSGAILNYGTSSANQRSGIILIGGKAYYVGEGNDMPGTSVLSLNTWHHVAATFDGSTLRMYVDGVQEAAQTKSFNTSGTTWRIGQRVAPLNSEFLRGTVDEVRVWNRALSATDVAASAQRNNPASLTGLLARWTMNEGSGTSLSDVTGNSPAGTLYNSPTWTTSGIVYSADMGARTVTLTVTDAGGNTSTAQATVTIVDTTPPVLNTRVLPTAPALALSNVPEAAGYGVLYQLDMPAAGNFGTLPAVPYTVNNASATLPANPTRVAYFMELGNASGTKWVWASMDNFATTLTQLGLPHAPSNPVNWHQSVSNLNVYSNNGGSLVTGASLGTGRVEMWPSDYGTTNSDNVPGASATTYDFGDGGQSTGNGYGSFQVHNLTNTQTVLAYNAWNKGDVDEMGIGNQVGGSGHPDWTFAHNVNTYTVRRLYILVNDETGATKDATVTLDAAGNATITAAQVYRGTATDNCTPTANLTVSVSPSSFTCANVGANPVTLTVTRRERQHQHGPGYGNGERARHGHHHLDRRRQHRWAGLRQLELRQGARCSYQRGDSGRSGVVPHPGL